MGTMLDLGILRATGWALLHFLWQGVALALVATITLRAGATLRATYRHLFAMAILAFAPLLFVATILGQLAAPLVATAPPPSPATVLQLSRDATAALSATAPSLQSDGQLFAIVALVWLLAVLVSTIRLGLAYRTAGRLCRALSSQLVPSAAHMMVEAALAQAQERMRVKRSIHLVWTPTGASPAVLGWLRAVVLFPITVASGLTPDQVELLLAHEVAHIRRHDFLINLLQSWIETLFFFHPAIRWLSSRIRFERELACDEAVVEAYHRPREYGEALAQLVLLNPPPPRLAMAATSSQLVVRIRRLLGNRQEAELMPHRPLLAVLISGGLLAVLAGGQLASAQSVMQRMLDQPGPARVISRQEHVNRFWDRSITVTMLADDGRLLSELRLGRRFQGMRFLAQLQPVDGRDTAIIALRAELYGWQGRREIDLVPPKGRLVDTSVDSLIMLFLRERGLNANTRGARLATETEAVGVLQEVKAIGDPVVRARYLQGGIAAVSSSTGREQLLVEALQIPNSSVEVSRAMRAAMKAARSPIELAAFVAHIPDIAGEAERLELLLEAIRIGGIGSPLLRQAIEHAIPTLPGDDARDAVRRALAGAT